MSTEKPKAISHEMLSKQALSCFECLRMAIYWRDPVRLGQLLREAPPGLADALSAEDGHGKTLLGLAVELKRADLVRMLVRAGAEVDLTMGGLPLTALHMSGINGCVETMRVLVESGADLEHEHPINGNSHVMACIGNRHEAAALYLIDKGARVDPEKVNMADSTTLDFATFCDSPAVFFRLFELGVGGTVREALEMLAKRGAVQILTAAVALPEWREAIVSEHGRSLPDMCKNGKGRDVILSVLAAHDVAGALDGAAEASSPEQTRSRQTMAL